MGQDKKGSKAAIAGLEYSHVCQFYETADDLLDVMVPYFKTGLERNQYCLWIGSHSDWDAEVVRGLKAAIPAFDSFLNTGQMEITDYSKWYLKSGVFSSEEAVNGCARKLKDAGEKGYQGVRVASDTGWIGQKDWKAFMHYQEKKGKWMSAYPVLVLHAYPLARRETHEVIDVVLRYRHVLVKRDGVWESMESTQHRRREETVELIEHVSREHRQAEEEKARLLALLEATPDFVGIASTRGDMLYMNRAARRSMGVAEKGPLPPLTLVKRYPKRELKRILHEAFPAAVKNGVWSGETVAVDFSGREIPVLQVLLAGKGSTGEVEYVSSIMRDITERKRMEETLRRSYEELEMRVAERTADLSEAIERLRNEAGERQGLITAIEQSADGVVLHDTRFMIQYANPAFLALSGYTLAELTGKSTNILRSERRNNAFYLNLRRTILRGDTWRGDYPLRRKNGSVIWVKKTISPIKDTGTINSYAMSCHDITERLHLEEQFHQSQKMEAIGRLAGGIAHDFNNILAIIMGNAELVLEDLRGEENTRRSVEQIVAATKRGKDLIRQILTFSRKSKGEQRHVSLRPVVEETYGMLRASLPSTLQMVLEIKTENDFVLADPLQVQEVIMNLATNAAQAMQSNKGSLTIELSDVVFAPGTHLPRPHMSPGPYVKLRVKDTGTGMTKDVRERIFEPFFTTREAGTGMGLAMVYGIVQNHSGVITLNTRPGRGSTFTIFLPRAPAEQQPEQEPAVHIPEGNERILFVEDEETLANVGCSTLERLGYQVTAMANSTDAWRLFIKEPFRFDLVITDQTMPGITGLALAGKMLQVRNDIPIILCTGYSDEVSADKVKESGIEGFVMKPIAKKELAVMVRRVLDQRKKTEPSR